MSLLNDTAPVGARQYWRSLDEMAETPEFKQFVEREFPAFASEMSSPFTRRTFLSLMGASMALAGMVTGCRKPVHNIVPYSKQPENTTPGLPTFYATSFACAGQVVGTLARTFEGRPVKLEGNPDFPTTLGALDGFTQALILQLYDPDRSMFPRNKGRQSESEAARQALAGLGAAARGKRGAGLRILSEPTTSPTLLALRAAFQAALPEAQWHVWEPVNQDAALAGAAAALGQPLQAHVDFSKANVVVALDSDFLSQGPETLLYQKQFSRRRKPELGPMNRLYSIECMFSVTGGMADHRLRLAPGEIDTFARALAASLGVSEAQTANSILPARAKEWLVPLAKDVRANAGKCAFVVGPQASVAVHALAAALNVMFGAECVRFTQPVDVATVNQLASLTELTRAMGQGSVETLVILGGNPVYNAPADLKFADALKRVPNSIHLSLYDDETSQACAWHLPEAHVLESWGDVQAFDGTIGLTQPLIAPLFGGLTASEVVSILFESPARTAYDIVYQHHRGAQTAAAFDATWRKCLHDGMVPAKGTTFAEASRTGQGLAELLKTAPASAPTQDSLSVQLLVSPTLHDGRFANNGWLMEMPHPTTKLTWDNAAYLSEQTARQLKLKTEDVVRLTTTAGELELPVYILPGIADFCVVVHLGYGRTAGGRIANGVGANAYAIRASQALYTLDKVKATRTSRVYQLANVQDHWSMENRPLVLEGGIKEYEAHPHELVAPAAAEHGAEHGSDKAHAPGYHEENLSPFKEHSYEHGPQWAMTIDLSACTGCGACTIACNAENNVPIVGKAQVRNGREMHWIRIDRYFATNGKGDAADNAEMVMQPMGCQQCETAPCEQVCPVAATTHSPDGLNEMTYNRCIGTRYCSNNCPFKVRRFNFFNYQETDLQRGGKPGLGHVTGSVGGNEDLISMARNPDVTVRMRGVMEKCTYCVQRIRRTTQEAKVAGAKLKDGDVLSACQQTCPSEAIIFGDVRDEKSLVALSKQNARNYELLSFLNLKTRTSYLARLRNPNPELVA